MAGGQPSTEQGHDTVGAVAIDAEGRVACATSTGGMPGKMCGRIGDCPLFGCGAYANKFGACSSTGVNYFTLRWRFRGLLPYITLAVTPGWKIAFAEPKGAPMTDNIEMC